MVTHWAGGLDPWRDLASMATPNTKHLTKSLPQAACLQLVHDGRPVPQQPPPNAAECTPRRGDPRTRGPPRPLTPGTSEEGPACGGR